jgi:probable HAF family extracellular repeat protein
VVGDATVDYPVIEGWAGEEGALQSQYLHHFVDQAAEWLWFGQTGLSTPANYSSSAASDISNSGQVIGPAYDLNWTSHAALWQGGTITDLGNEVATGQGVPNRLRRPPRGRSVSERLSGDHAIASVDLRSHPEPSACIARR